MSISGDEEQVPGVTQQSNPAPLDVEGCVKFYVELRDAKAAIAAKAKEDSKPYTEGMEKLEAVLLKHLQDSNQTSASTKAGTVYRTTDRSATVKDKMAFKEFVISQQQWDLADWKANKVQVFDYIEEHGTDVPGVNTSAFATIGVRRGNSEE